VKCDHRGNVTIAFFVKLMSTCILAQGKAERGTAVAIYFSWFFRHFNLTPAGAFFEQFDSRRLEEEGS
jgi:hypothetical protein